MIPPLAVLITARDEEEQLPRSLASVSGWADEIVVVVDPRTTDRTRELARVAGAAVLEHPFASSAAQCNWGLENCASRWVLVLDADERVTPRLREAIGASLADATAAAFSIRRRNLAFGRPVRFGDWGRDEIVRLLDRTRARFVERAVHGAVAAAPVGRLAGEIVHDTLRSLEQYLGKLDEYARRGASEAIAGGRRSGPGRALARACWRFVRSYVLRAGFLDGGVGVVVGALAAWGTFLKWVRVWEGTTRRGPRP